MQADHLTPQPAVTRAARIRYRCEARGQCVARAHERQLDAQHPYACGSGRGKAHAQRESHAHQWQWHSRATVCHSSCEQQDLAIQCLNWTATNAKVRPARMARFAPARRMPVSFAARACHAWSQCTVRKLTGTRAVRRRAEPVRAVCALRAFVTAHRMLCTWPDAHTRVIVIARAPPAPPAMHAVLRRT